MHFTSDYSIILMLVIASTKTNYFIYKTEAWDEACTQVIHRATDSSSVRLKYPGLSSSVLLVLQGAHMQCAGQVFATLEHCGYSLTVCCVRGHWLLIRLDMAPDITRVYRVYFLNRPGNVGLDSLYINFHRDLL